MSRRAVVLFLLLFSVSICFAQQKSQESVCDLNIRIRTEQDRSYDMPVQVELLSAQGIPMAVSHTSGAGTADFQVMGGSTYKIRVSGQDIETTLSPEIVVLEREQVHMETINVRVLEPNDQNKASGEGTAPTVSVAEMNVPGKARDEMQKGTEAFAKGDMKKAQERFTKAIADYPQYARAYSNLGVIAIREGDRPKAREMFSKAVEVDDKFLPGYVNLARMDYQDHNYRESETLLQKVMAVNPSLPEALALLAGVEFMNKEYEKALSDALRTHTLPNHEQFADVHLVAAKIYQMQSHAQEAVSEYRQFLKENPNSPRAAMVQQQLTTLQAGQH
jgi:Tfp pilus assembly protein PilF